MEAPKPVAGNFDKDEKKKIYNIQLQRGLSQGAGPDKIRLGYSSKGTYSAQEDDTPFIQKEEGSGSWSHCWSTVIWPKVGLFYCMTVRNKILATKNLIISQPLSLCPITEG